MAPFRRPTVTVPDPLILTASLVAVVVTAAAVIGMPVTGIVDAFTWGMFAPAQLAFGFQMALVLLTGTAIAAAPPVAAGLRTLAAIPQTARSATVLVALTAMGAGLLNWGLGLIVGAVLAREVGRSLRARGIAVRYGVLGAAGYCSIAVWHGGLSGSAPLKVATASAGFGDAVPVGLTIGSTLNLVTTTTVVIAITLTLAWLVGRGDDDCVVPAVANVDGDANAPDSRASPGLASRLLGLVLLAVVATAVVRAVVDRGTAAITLDWFIAGCVALGLLAHLRAGPASWGRAMSAGAADVGGVLLHFPLYFGCVAVAVNSGLIAGCAEGMASVAQALPLAASTAVALSTFVSAAVINLVVPSGGGQWAVQAPLIAASAQAAAVAKAPLVMAFAYGDQLTNLLQPFWALPVLSITGLSARDLLPVTAVVMVVEGVVVAACLLLLT